MYAHIIEQYLVIYFSVELVQIVTSSNHVYIKSIEYSRTFQGKEFLILKDEYTWLHFKVIEHIPISNLIVSVGGKRSELQVYNSVYNAAGL